MLDKDSIRFMNIPFKAEKYNCKMLTSMTLSNSENTATVNISMKTLAYN